MAARDFAKGQAMAEQIDVDICVIGGGSGGLSVAAGASQMGARTVLIERHKMGGDCLHYGCVPSKSLIAAGRSAEIWRQAGRFGVNGSKPEVDFARVHDHVHGVISTIEHHDSVERFTGLGVQVIEASGTFVSRDTVEAGGKRIRARRFVVATGSAAAVPPIEGLDQVPFLTNRTIFEQRDAPRHLIVIGGGPIGVELAQAHRRLGSEVTIVEMFSVLGNDDPELTAVVRDRLALDGIAIHEGVKVERVEGGAGAVSVTVEADGETRRIDGSHLLVAAGRKANVDGLGLDAAGIAYSPKGITVDARLRTTNKRVFAIGDVAGGYQFTHMAGYHAGIVIRNALFRLPAKVDYRAVPWVTYTDPELSHVGLSEAMAKKNGETIRVLRWSFEENDRAQAERETEGMAKVITNAKGRILGASIVGAHAGELIQPWVLAIYKKLKIGDMASIIAPYPTFSEVNKRLAGSYFTPTLFGERTRKVVRFLAKFG